MARARWLKPEFFTDEKCCTVSDEALLVFAAIWVEADDGGVAPGDPRILFGRRFIKRERWGWTPERVTDAMRELHAGGLALGFTYRGEQYVLIPDFAQKQGIKPKHWRHLGPVHDTVLATLREQPPLKPSSNGVGTALEPEFTPKPLAVAVSLKPKAVAEAVAGDDDSDAAGQADDDLPQRQDPEAVRCGALASSPAAQEAYDELLRQVPEAYREAVVGVIRAALDPVAVVLTIRAAGPGGANECGSWEVLGQAVLELRATGSRFSPVGLHAFCRRIVADAKRTPTGRTEAEQAVALAEAERRGGVPPP